MSVGLVVASYVNIWNWFSCVLQAALCSIRIIKKVLDLAENFISPAASLLKEKHHGVLITGVQLCIDLCDVSAEALDYFRKVNCRSWTRLYVAYNFIVLAQNPVETLNWMSVFAILVGIDLLGISHCPAWFFHCMNYSLFCLFGFGLDNHGWRTSLYGNCTSQLNELS